MSTSKETAEHKKRCFVVMGFGIKTDLATGRKLDLNKSYRLLVKPVVEAKGLECIRADEIRHSGIIDYPLYQELLKADVVIADLSTANVNAFYELGIRHALRPFTTVVISEDKLSYPFDLNHINITSYTHLGDVIDGDEVIRFTKLLGETLQAVLDKQQPDSPVYTFLDNLVPPGLKEETANVLSKIGDAMEEEVRIHAGQNKNKQSKQRSKTLSLVLEQGEAALKKKNYTEATKHFQAALEMTHSTGENAMVSNDPYIIQRLALTTYKAKKPNALSALNKSMKLLKNLDLDHTNDPETVALAGAIEKRLYENSENDKHLENAILFYQRGYYLLNNRYNAINLAFMLNCRANSSLSKTRDEKVADLIYAIHTRKRVLYICKNDWEVLSKKNNIRKKNTEESLREKKQSLDDEQRFWILINKAEAHFGLGEFKAFAKAKSEAGKLQHEEWMMESFETQIQKLEHLLKKTGNLLDPPWKLPK